MTRPELSVVLPCLDESRALPRLLRELQGVLRRTGVATEIVVCDNASTDGSAALARRLGARVVSEPRRGYGHACWKGIQEARGRFVVLMDADGTYDPEDLVRVWRALKKGAAFVLGNRLGGRIERGAMPRLHRWVGTPLLARAIRLLHGGSFHDPNCGLRGLRRAVAESIAPASEGMESASEMVLRVLQRGLRTDEIPVGYRPRRAGASKLRPVRDGMRHLLLILTAALPRDA